MAERTPDVFRLVMEVTTTEADPAKWNWEEILDLGHGERVRIVDSERLHVKHSAWQVVTYDLWSDGEGGLSVNDKFKSGTIYMAPTANEGDVLQQVCDLVGGDWKKLSFDNNTWSENVIYVLDENGNPACELVREEN